MTDYLLNQVSKNRITKKVVFIAFLGVFALAAVFCVFGAENTNSLEFLTTDECTQKWNDWKKNNSKTYGVSEEITRFATFLANCNEIKTFNAKPSRFKLDVNEFTDQTNTEWDAAYNALNITEEEEEDAKMEDGIEFEPAIAAEATDLPKTWDWREKGGLTPVKSQGGCGSCYIFSAIGVLEAFALKQTGKVFDFSEQDVLDCANAETRNGCKGGNTAKVFSYARKNGLANESQIPYLAKKNVCHKTNRTVVFQNLTGYRSVKAKDITALKQALLEGPVTIGVAASSKVFQNYKSGILDSDDCWKSKKINHAVVAVGYTEEAIIVRNSWGSKWGDKGYIQIAYDVGGSDGICGIRRSSSKLPYFKP